MASKPPSNEPPFATAGPAVPELDKKLAAGAKAPDRVVAKPPASPPPDDDDEDGDEDELDLDDDEDDEDLVVFTAKEAAGALATVYAFVRPFLKNYKKVLALVGLGGSPRADIVSVIFSGSVISSADPTACLGARPPAR